LMGLISIFAPACTFNKRLHTSHDVAWCKSELKTDFPENADLFFETLCFARRESWTWELTERLFNIVLTTLEYETQNPLCTMEDSFSHFKKNVLLFCCERPPWTVGMFTEDQLKSICQFVLDHHYRFFSLHKQIVETVDIRL